MAASLNPGCRVAYTAAYLKALGSGAGVYALTARRGTFLGFDFPGFCRIRWDDEAAILQRGIGYFAQKDFCADVIAHGSFEPTKCLAKVGSARFGDTYAA